MTKNQYILYMVLLVLLIVLSETHGGVPTMNIYEFWEMVTH
jgi:hypothetical protein